MDLDVRRLRMLREVALRGTVTAAAQALGFTPSAISQQLSVLEREAGTALLERAGRRVRLTGSGEALVSHTGPVLAALEEAQAALEASREAVAGEVRVAASGSVARALVVPAAAAAGAARPRLRVIVLEPGTADGMMRELRLGQLDVAVTHRYTRRPPEPDPDLAQDALFAEDMVLVAPAGRLCPPARVADLAAQVWAAEPAHSECGQATRAACRDAGFEPDIRFISSEPGVLLSAVVSAGAVALLPGLSVARPPAGVDVLALAGPGISRTVVAVHRRGSARRPAIALILASLRGVARELAVCGAWPGFRLQT